MDDDRDLPAQNGIDATEYVDRIRARLAITELSKISQLVVSAHNYQGNYDVRYRGERAVWETVLDDILTTQISRTLGALHEQYELECKKRGVTPASIRTTCHRVAVIYRQLRAQKLEKNS